MNAVEKMHALLVAEDVLVWHYPQKKEGHRFYFWLPKLEPDNAEGHGFNTLEAMVEAAYEHIDPLKKPLPNRLSEPSAERG